MSSGRSSRPAGSPSTIAVSPGPWDSPAVTNRKDMTPTPYKRGCGRQVGGGTAGRGLLFEGDVRRAGTRCRVGRARVEGVHGPGLAAAVDARHEAGRLAAPVGLAVSIHVADHLVHLRDVAVVVVVLVVLAVEERVAVHIRVGQVNVEERTLVEVTRALPAVGLLLPLLDLERLLLPEAGPPGV